MIEESSEGGVEDDGSGLASIGVRGGDVEGKAKWDFDDVDGGVEDMNDSDDSREHSERSKNTKLKREFKLEEHDAPGPRGFP